MGKELEGMLGFLFSFFQGAFLISFLIFLASDKAFGLADAIPFALLFFFCLFGFQSKDKPEWLSALKENTPRIISPLFVGAFLVFSPDPIRFYRELFLYFGIFAVLFSFYKIGIKKERLHRNDLKNIVSFILRFLILLLIIVKALETVDYFIIPFIFTVFYFPYAFSYTLFGLIGRFKEKLTNILFLAYVAPIVIVLIWGQLTAFFLSFMILGLSEYIMRVFYN